MSQYARGTEVPIEKSRAELEGTLRRYGAQFFRHGWGEMNGLRAEQIEFMVHDRLIRFNMPMPARTDPEFQMDHNRVPRPRSPQAVIKAWDQACRQRWRALCLVVKAKLEAVESGIVQFEQEFLAQIVDPKTDRTIGDTLRPQLAQLGKIELPGLPSPETAHRVPQ